MPVPSQLSGSKQAPRLARNVTPLANYVELFIRELAVWDMLEIEPSQGRMEGLRKYSLALCRKVFSLASTDMERSAGNGIREAVALMLDPDYYETRRERQSKRTKATALRHHEERRQVQRQRESGFTRLEIARKAARIESLRQYHAGWLKEQLPKELAELDAMKRNPEVEAMVI